MSILDDGRVAGFIKAVQFYEAGFIKTAQLCAVVFQPKPVGIVSVASLVAAGVLALTNETNRREAIRSFYPEGGAVTNYTGEEVKVLFSQSPNEAKPGSPPIAHSYLQPGETTDQKRHPIRDTDAVVIPDGVRWVNITTPDGKEHSLESSTTVFNVTGTGITGVTTPALKLLDATRVVLTRPSPEVLNVTVNRKFDDKWYNAARDALFSTFSQLRIGNEWGVKHTTAEQAFFYFPKGPEGNRGDIGVSWDDTIPLSPIQQSQLKDFEKWLTEKER
jgi:hypothetical protein